MSAEIKIEVRGYSATGVRYRVFHDGAILIESCRNPFLDAARALSKNNVTGRLRMSRVGSDQIDAEGLIAILATKTISETERHGPRIVKFVAREFELEDAA